MSFKPLRDPKLPLTQHDLKKYALGPVRTPRCPLCLKMMEKLWVPQRKLFVFKCDTEFSCKIAIRVDDPFVGRWDAAREAAEKKTGEKLVCPNPRCAKAPEGDIRYFATMTGFLKLYCVCCHATMKNTEPDRKKDEIYTPDAPSITQGGEGHA